MKISIEEKGFILFIVVLFLSMTYAIFSSAAEAQDFPSERSITHWAPPTIPECELPLWERIRHMCPKETDNE